MGKCLSGGWGNGKTGARQACLCVARAPPCARPALAPPPPPSSPLPPILRQLRSCTVPRTNPRAPGSKAFPGHSVPVPTFSSSPFCGGAGAGARGEGEGSSQGIGWGILVVSALARAHLRSARLVGVPEIHVDALDGGIHHRKNDDLRHGGRSGKAGRRGGCQSEEPRRGGGAPARRWGRSAPRCTSDSCCSRSSWCGQRSSPAGRRRAAHAERGARARKSQQRRSQRAPSPPPPHRRPPHQRAPTQRAGLRASLK